MAKVTKKQAKKIKKDWMGSVAKTMDKGGLHESLGIPKGKKIPITLTKKIASSKRPSLKRSQAQLSLNMQGIKK